MTVLVARRRILGADAGYTRMLDMVDNRVCVHVSSRSHTNVACTLLVNALTYLVSVRLVIYCMCAE